jgi:hypothetical protein
MASLESNVKALSHWILKLYLHRVSTTKPCHALDYWIQMTSSSKLGSLGQWLPVVASACCMSQVMAQQALPIAACSAVDEIALPLVVLFVMSSQQLISGLTTGVVK